MESEILNNVKDVKSRTISSVIRKRKKNSMAKFYAGVILFYVPSVLCGSDRSRPKHLTYDSIFNSTNYVQIQHSPKPYGAVSYSFLSQSFSEVPKNKIRQTSVIEHRPFNEFRPIKPLISNIPIRIIRPTIEERPTIQNNAFIEEEPFTIRNISAIDEDTKGNELEYQEFDYSEEAKEQLLVGFSHDPFRYSIPEQDYKKGVRTMDPETFKRGKRGVFHLYNMMYCATGCEPLAYKGYGCYCGFLGSGRPTDGIDRCCKMHDECYENIFCPFYTVYFQPYYWKCYRGQPLCAIENYKSQHQFISGCAGRLCECDRRFAMCVKRYACPRRRALCRSSPIRLLQNLLMFK